MAAPDPVRVRVRVHEEDWRGNGGTLGSYYRNDVYVDDEDAAADEEEDSDVQAPPVGGVLGPQSLLSSEGGGGGGSQLPAEEVSSTAQLNMISQASQAHVSGVPFHPGDGHGDVPFHAKEELPAASVGDEHNNNNNNNNQSRQRGYLPPPVAITSLGQAAYAELNNREQPEQQQRNQEQQNQQPPPTPQTAQSKQQHAAQAAQTALAAFVRRESARKPVDDSAADARDATPNDFVAMDVFAVHSRRATDPFAATTKYRILSLLLSEPSPTRGLSSTLHVYVDVLDKAAEQNNGMDEESGHGAKSLIAPPPLDLSAAPLAATRDASTAQNDVKMSAAMARWERKLLRASKVVCFLELSLLRSFEGLAQIATALYHGKSLVFVVLDAAAYDTLKSPRGTELLWTSSAELAQNQARIWIPSLERARYSKAAAGEGVDAIEEDALCPFLRCSSKSVGLLLNRIRRDVNAGMVCFCRPSEDYAGRDVSQVDNFAIRAVTRNLRQNEMHARVLWHAVRYVEQRDSLGEGAAAARVWLFSPQELKSMQAWTEQTMRLAHKPAQSLCPPLTMAQNAVLHASAAGATSALARRTRSAILIALTLLLVAAACIVLLFLGIPNELLPPSSPCTASSSSSSSSPPLANPTTTSPPANLVPFSELRSAWANGNASVVKLSLRDAEEAAASSDAEIRSLAAATSAAVHTRTSSDDAMARARLLIRLAARANASHPAPISSIPPSSSKTAAYLGISFDGAALAVGGGTWVSIYLLPQKTFAHALKCEGKAGSQDGSSTNIRSLVWDHKDPYLLYACGESVWLWDARAGTMSAPRMVVAPPAPSPPPRPPTAPSKSPFLDSLGDDSPFTKNRSDISTTSTTSTTSATTSTTAITQATAAESTKSLQNLQTLDAAAGRVLLLQSDSIKVYDTSNSGAASSSLHLFAVERSMSDPYTAARFAHGDAKRAVAGTASGAIVFYSFNDANAPRVETRSVLYTPDSGDGVASLDWSPDDRFVAVGTRQGRVHVYFVTASSEIKSFRPVVSFVNIHTAPILGVTFSPSGTFLVTGDAKGQIRVTNAAWSEAGQPSCLNPVATAHALGDVNALSSGIPETAIVSIAFGSDSDESLAIATADGRTTTIALSPSALVSHALKMVGPVSTTLNSCM